MDKIQETFLK